MEYFQGGGGLNSPYFAHRIRINRMSNPAFLWCQQYPATGYFQRFHVEWGSNQDPEVDYDIVQFENEKAALMFRLTWGHI